MLKKLEKDGMIEESLFFDKYSQVLQEIFAKTVRLIDQHQLELEKITQLLLEKGTVSGYEIYKILGKQCPMLCFEYNRIIDEIEKYYDYQ